MASKSKSNFLLFLATVTLLILIGGIFLGKYFSSSSTPSQPLSSVSSTNWKTFENLKENYSIEYPANWQIRDENNNVDFGDNKTWIISIKIHPRGDTVYLNKIWKTKNCIICDYDVAPIPYSDIKILAIANQTVYWNQDGSGSVHGFIVNKIKKNIIEFSSWGPNRETILQQILSTFKFTN